MIEELDREADDFIICDNSLVFVSHLSTVLIRSIRCYFKKKKKKSINTKDINTDDETANVFKSNQI